MTGRIIVPQGPGLWITIFGSNTTDSGHQTLQNFEIICGGNCLANWSEFPVDDSFALCSILVFQHRQKSCLGRTVINFLFINRLEQTGITGKNVTAFKRRSEYIDGATSYSNMVRGSELI